ncbi:MbtH family protein [Microbulbifer sp. ANSA003]|uniref:MbtH family protein n=1 Tax=Microbulbifer sp. ANSA003 TaxID=3243360 RepID=UPI0040431CDA
MDYFEKFVVVCNHEMQYSLWPQEKAVPQGWEKTDFSGTKKACLEYIAKTWRDITPKSLQTQLASA